MVYDLWQNINPPWYQHDNQSRFLTPRFLDCPFLIAPLFFSNVYLLGTSMIVRNRQVFRTVKCDVCGLFLGKSWSYALLYGSWMYIYLCNQCLSPLKLWVRIPLRRGVPDKTSCDKVYQSLATGRWFTPGIPVSSTNNPDRHDITEILLKVVLNTITITTPPPPPVYSWFDLAGYLLYYFSNLINPAL
jgi:hypothetical protein